jgi:hypothetical protein
MGQFVQNNELIVDYTSGQTSYRIHLEIPLDDQQAGQASQLLEARNVDALAALLKPLVHDQCKDMIDVAVTSIPPIGGS